MFSGRGRPRGGHRPGSSAGGSRAAELSNAYASLAEELTKKEIKSVGGYTFGRVIGAGAFGKVFLGIHRLTNTRVAIKQVPKSLPFTSDPSSPLSLLTREIHHHRRLRHPHLLALYEIIATESSIYMVTELCTGGELFDYLVEKGRLSIAETRRIFGQLVLGVAHLHKSGVVHRDLKLENVLLDERVNVKIADLGFGREFERGRLMDTWVGSLGYSAPEMVAGKKYLGEEVDIWSLGVILYTLLTGSLPCDDDDEAIMKEKILNCEYEIPTWLDEDAADLIRNILQLDPLHRLSLKNILSHKFFTAPKRSHFDVFDERIPLEVHSELPEESYSDHNDHQGSPEMYQQSQSSASHVTTSDIASDALVSHEEIKRSGATTPNTSEDESHAQSRHREPNTNNLQLSQKNESQSTLAVKHFGSGAMESLKDPETTSYLGINATPLSRNISNSSTISVVSQNGSPIPIHTRTPSRTKRQSVGSLYSERLFSLDEEEIQSEIDYLALLGQSAPEMLTTKLEKDLLDSLTTLGFDTGQMVHSIQTYACDSSAAMWWMLKRKAEITENERELENKDAVSTELPPKTKAKSTQTDFPHPLKPSYSSRTSSLNFPKTRKSSSNLISNETVSSSASSTPSPTPLPQKPASPARTVSGNMLMVPQVNEKVTSISAPSSPHRSVKNHSVSTKDSKRRNRTSSLNMLQLATSVLGGTLTMKKQTNVEDTEDPRQRSIDKLDDFHPSSSLDRAMAPNTPPSQTLTNLISASYPNEASSAADSHDTFTTITSESSVQNLPTISNTPMKRNRTSLFSSFKLWFGEDKRKRKRSPLPGSAHSEQGTLRASQNKSKRVAIPTQLTSAGLSKSSSIKRPSRRSSNASIAPPSRRSSINSNRDRGRDGSFSAGPSFIYTHHRRRSDGSRNSLSDCSRPASLRSNSVGRRTRHHKSGSVSSATSQRRSTKDVYRRPPTTTTVRRIHHSAASRHSRNGSASSCVTRHSSSSSIVEEKYGSEMEQKNQAPIIEEESETDKDETGEDTEVLSQPEQDQARRAHALALRQLSGGQSSQSLHSMNSNSSIKVAVFSAHKTRHIFGTPSQPHAGSLSRKSSNMTIRPPLRDVFARKDSDEWVDEDDEFDGYSGGLGQPSSRQSQHTSTASTSSTASSIFSVDSSTSSQSYQSLGAFDSSKKHSVFEARYGSAAVTAEPGSWRMNTARGATTRSATVIEEEEEEE